MNKHYNIYVDKGDYFEMSVNNSHHIYKIDKQYYDFATKYTWYSDPSYKNDLGNPDYPYLTAKTMRNNKWIHIRYHMEIMQDEIKEYKREHDYDKKIIVDHKDGDCTNDLKDNLRVRTQSENNMNKEMQSNNTTGVVGVSWHIRDKIWSSRISYKDEIIDLGSFYYFRNAVKARVEAEDKYFDEHALKERDTNTYKEYLNYFLSLPEMKEPVLRNRPNNEFNILGIKRRKNDKYTAYISDNKNKKKIEKAFNNFDDAFKWRKAEEILIYGQEIMYADEKLEKVI